MLVGSHHYPVSSMLRWRGSPCLWALGRRWLSDIPKALLDAEQESVLLRIFRTAGPLSKRQVAEIVDKSGMSKSFASKARVDRHIQHLTAHGTLVVHRIPGAAGKFALADGEPRATAPP